MAKLYNPNNNEQSESEEPNSTNIKIGDVYLHRNSYGDIIPFCVKKIHENNFAAWKRKKGPGLSITWTEYSDAVILKNQQDPQLLVGRNCREHLEDYLEFINQNPDLRIFST